MKSTIHISITVDDAAKYPDLGCSIEKEVSCPDGWGHMFTPVSAAELHVLNHVLQLAEHNNDICGNGVNSLDCYSLVAQINNFEPGKSPEKSPAYVYLLKCADKYKVGYSHDVKRRMKQLDTRPFPLELIAAISSDYAYAVEQKLHEMASPYRAVSEWYSEDLAKLFQGSLITPSAFEALVHRVENDLVQDFSRDKFTQYVETHPIEFFAKTMDETYGWYSTYPPENC